MALDSRLVIASDLQSVFRDKDTGLPLRNGVIYYWQDEARSVAKNIFIISGTPPNYTYVNIGAVVELTASGTFSNNQNPASDVVPYYFPYTGAPTGTSTTVQNYYIEVYSEGGKATGVLQFTRSAWPNIVSETTQTADFENFAPNGQLLLHYDVPASEANTYIAGKITEPSTPIAAGGWTFERSVGSTATDIITFVAFGSAVTVPSGNPEFFLQVQCDAPNAGDVYKDVCLTYEDVNKFASTTEKYTYGFSGESNGTGSISASIVLRKNFDDTGSNYTETTLKNITIPNGSFTIIQTDGFVFGTNLTETIGDGNSVQLRLRLPVNSVYDVSLTDFVLAKGSDVIEGFPPTTNAQFSYQSLPPAIPAYDGSTFYLPMVSTPNGLYYDDACIGDTAQETQLSVYVNSLHPTSNRMLADGSEYATEDYSPIGIPFARLQSKYWVPSINAPKYGTGNAFLTAYISDVSPPIQLRIATNARGATTNISDGVAATGFAFATPATGADYGITAYRNAVDTLIAISDFTSAVPVPAAGTSGFTVTDIVNQANRKHVFTVETIAATTLAGKYFTWEDPATLYYMWFKVDGTGSDPAVPSATGIEVDLLSTYGADEVACFVLEAMSGYQISTVITNAASTLTAGDYFNLSTLTDTYYVWYSINTSGTDPKPVGKIGIKVPVLSADTAAQVATKTQIAINSKYFAAPAFQGLFFRAYDPDQLWDVDALTRFGKNSAYYGNEIGLMQLDEFLLHFHEYTKVQGSGGIVAGGATFADNVSEETSAVGGNETRGVNATVNVAILY